MPFRSVAWADAITTVANAATANGTRFPGTQIVPTGSRSGHLPLKRSCTACGNGRPAVALRDASQAQRGAPRGSSGPFGGRRRGNLAGRGLREPCRRDPGIAPDGSLRRQRRVGHGPAAGCLPSCACGRLPARGAAGSLRRPPTAPRHPAGGRGGPGGLLAERRRDAPGFRAACPRAGPGRGVLPRGHRADRLAPRGIRAARPRLHTRGRRFPHGRGAYSRSRLSATWAGRC